jgi:hypothetical protein
MQPRIGDFFHLTALAVWDGDAQIAVQGDVGVVLGVDHTDGEPVYVVRFTNNRIGDLYADAFSVI